MASTNFGLKFGLLLCFSTGFLIESANAKHAIVENFPIQMRYLSEQKKRVFSDVTKARLNAWASQSGKVVYYSDKLPAEGFITDAAMKSITLVSPNRRVNPEFLNRVFAHRGNQLLHIESAGDQVAIYLVGAKEADAIALFDFFKNAEVASGSVPATGGRAPASETVTGGGPAGGSDSTSNTGEQSYGYALVESFESCALGVKQGAEGVIITPFTMAWGSVKSLYRNPSAWWDRSVKEANAVVDTVKTFNEFAARTWAGFKSKTSAEKSQLYCSFVGGPAALGAVAKVAKISSTSSSAASAGSAEVSTSSKISPLHSSGGAGSVVDQLAVNFMDDVAKGLSSGVEIKIAAALQKIKNFKGTQFSEEFVNSVGIVQLNNKVLDITLQLDRLMKSSAVSEAAKVQIAQAYVHYGKVASGGWTKGPIGRLLSDFLPDAVGNPSIPDAARRILHQAQIELYRANGFGTVGAFETGAVLKAKDTIGFLGRMRSELSPRQTASVGSIEYYFASQPPAVQKAIFASMESGRGVPQVYLKEMATKATLANKNSLVGTLHSAGFVATPSQRGNLITYTHPESKSQIIMTTTKNLSAGMPLRGYSPQEVNRIRAAISQPGGRYTITNNAP